MEISKKLFNVSVVLPIKSMMSQGFDDYFKKCIDSIKNQKVGIRILLN